MREAAWFGLALLLVGALAGGCQQQITLIREPAVAAGSVTGQSRGQAAEPAPAGPSAAPGADDEPYTGPAVVFRPRPHVPHPRAAAKQVDLQALPKLVSRFNQCFPPPEPPAAAYGARGGRSMAKLPQVRMGAASVSGGSVGGAGRGFGSGSGRPAAARRPSVAMVSPPPGPPPTELRPKPAPPPAGPPGGQGYYDWGASIYLSNDDSMSLSSAQRILFAIDRFLPLPQQHIRPHELLNYFDFDTQAPDADHDFAVLANLEPSGSSGQHTLALSVQGRRLDRATRRPAALTFVIDRSGSMSAEGRMTFLKRGLGRMVQQLRDGDLINLVLFDDEICVPVQSFVAGRDPQDLLWRVIKALEPRGSTDLHLGLTKGYELATAGFQRPYSNRVVMITDAEANTGVTSQQLIAAVGQHYDSHRIRLSGVGVGRTFNDALLDQLTERGRGAYVFLGSEEEVDDIFGDRFVSLIETTAVDVHFRLHLPPSLGMKTFYGEESSTDRRDVQAIHYFANTSQLFLSDLAARGGVLRPQDSIMLTVEYKDPETEVQLLEEYAFSLGQILGPSRNVGKGRLVMRWVDGLALLGARTAPQPSGAGAGSWIDEEGYRLCQQTRQKLSELGSGLPAADTEPILALWDKYCSRYERPRSPVKRDPLRPTP